MFFEKKKLIRFQTVVTGILVPTVVLYFDIVVKVSSVIRPKDESQDGGNKKSKYVKFSEKKKNIYPLICIHKLKL